MRNRGAIWASSLIKLTWLVFCFPGTSDGDLESTRSAARVISSRIRHFILAQERTRTEKSSLLFIIYESSSKDEFLFPLCIASHCARNRARLTSRNTIPLGTGTILSRNDRSFEYITTLGDVQTHSQLTLSDVNGLDCRVNALGVCAWVQHRWRFFKTNCKRLFDV